MSKKKKSKHKRKDAVAHAAIGEYALLRALKSGGKGKKKGSKAGSRSKAGRRAPTARAKQAYYKNIRKSYQKLKKVAEIQGFA